MNKINFTTGEWSGGMAEWTEGNTAFLSVAFTWKMPDAYQKAIWYASQGYTVLAGGPAVFLLPKYLADVALCGGNILDAVTKQNPQTTFASRGCPVGCYFCSVPAMEGKTFTLLPEFTPRPVLCDNNLSALPSDYQDHIIARYKGAGIPLLDANSGFEPRTFDGEVYRRWDVIIKGPWRFAYDDQEDGPYVERVMKMLKNVPQKRKRVYVLIGNEPFESCMERIQRVIDWGGDPHCQPLLKLNTLVKSPWVRYDWNEQLLRDVARWCNGWVWRKAPFSEYQRSKKSIIVDPNQKQFIYFD